MNIYYDRYKCADCGRGYWLCEGAKHCPSCGGELRRISRGRAKTVRVCRTAGKVLFSAALVMIIAAIAARSGVLAATAITSAVISMAALGNAGLETMRRTRR